MNERVDCNIVTEDTTWHVCCITGVMMNPSYLRRELPIEGIGEPLYFFSTIGSTNDYARELAEQGAPHGTLIIADEQTAGRGRSGKKWMTPSGSAVAMSVVMRDLPSEQSALGGLNVLGTLAVLKTLEPYRHKVEMKWPNDVLLEARKVGGVLVEPLWAGTELEAAVVGIGVNVTERAVPPAEMLDFPAASLEGTLKRPIEREALLVEIVRQMAGLFVSHKLSDLPGLCEPYLAYRGEQVSVEVKGSQTKAQVLGLKSDGRLAVQLEHGEQLYLRLEEASVRPIDSRAR